MRLDCYSYQLPFTQPLESSSGIYANREGFILEFSGPGVQCYGEAAPLPGFSSETLGDTQTKIENHIDDWSTLLNTDHPIQHLQAHYLAEGIPPALQFGLDSLAYQSEAQKTNKSLAFFLFKDSFSTVAVNGLLSLIDSDNPISSVQKLISDGFRTIKCKVGTQWPYEQKVLTQIRNQFPDLRIRLDANRAWTLDEAVSNLSALRSVDIEYCEEPLRQPAPEQYRELSRRTPFPLALDESVNKNQDWESLLPYCSVLIIKPMVIGGFTKLFAIRQQAQKYNCSLVFTSSLESSIGRTITAVLASGLGSKDYAHGLHTGPLLARDVASNQPKIISGSIPSKELNTTDVDRTNIETLATTIISSK